MDAKDVYITEKFDGIEAKRVKNTWCALCIGVINVGDEYFFNEKGGTTLCSVRCVELHRANLKE